MVSSSSALLDVQAAVGYPQYLAVATVSEEDNMAESKNIEIECQSCGADLADMVGAHVTNPESFIDDNLCRGCDLVICEACVVVFNHFQRGAHGKGDPWVECDRLRAAEH